MSERKLTTTFDVESALASVSFAKSCIDMGWQWEVRKDHLTGGFLIRTTFQRPDRETGVIATGYGRWWHVPEGATHSAVAKTAFAAAKMILEHELMEAFRFGGVRIFDPHHTVADLTVAALSNARSNA